MSASVHNQSSDTPCLIPHLESLRVGLGHLPQNAVANAASGSEENDDYLKQHGVGHYLKYSTFYQDTHHYRNPELIRKHQFCSDHFEYDEPNDQFFCAVKRRLSYHFTIQYKTDNSYLSTRRHYECERCQECPLKSQCTKAKGNRQIQVSFQLREYCRQAQENPTSPPGQELLAGRSVEVETSIGDIKQNMASIFAASRK